MHCVHLTIEMREREREREREKESERERVRERSITEYVLIKSGFISSKLFSKDV